MSDQRGVLYVKWGNKLDSLLERSIASLHEVHPELPIHIHELAPTATLLDKSQMSKFSPFEITLYLDCDTVVLGCLHYAFTQAEQHRLACCICECPWARRYRGLSGDLVEYNTGVLCFSREMQQLFRTWQSYSREIDSSVEFVRDGQLLTMLANDQASFAKAVYDSGIVPYVLPCNWNLRIDWHRSFWGPIKIWHNYGEVPQWLLSWNRMQAADGAVIQYMELESGPERY